MKLKLNALKVNSLLSRDQMKNVMAGYGNNGCGVCSSNPSYACINNGSVCYCPLGGGCMGL